MNVDELLRTTGRAWQAPPTPPLDAGRTLARQAQRRRARVMAATAAVVLVAGAAGFAGWPRGIPATPVTGAPSAGLPTGSPQTAQNDPGVSAETKALIQRARTAAQSLGSGTTGITAQAVLTSRDAAERLLEFGQSKPVVDTSVWVVQLRGEFACPNCPRPTNAPAPQGTVIQLVIPKSDLLTTDHDSGGGMFGMGDRPVDLSRLGTVIDLDLG